MGSRNAEGGTRNSKTTRRSSLLGFLHPPFPGDQIFEQYRSSATFKNHFDASARYRLSPPFIVDAPDFADSLNCPPPLVSRLPQSVSRSGRLRLCLIPISLCQ